MTVAILDWGIGGLSVYRELIKVRPGLHYLYLSDSGFTPYGKTSKLELIERLHLISDFFRQKNIRNIVIACNAASTVLYEVQKKNPDLKYIGMLDSGVVMIENSKVKNCLILGGQRTIQSKFFQNYFASHAVTIQAKVAQPLSAFIEKGDVSSKAFHKSLVTILSKLKIQPDSILLACTHYPAIEPQIKKLMPNAKILDPGLQVTKNICKKISRAQGKGKTVFFTTGKTAAMKASAKKAFGLELGKINKVILK